MLPYLESFLAGEDISAIWAMHCKRMADFGFDRIFYACACLRTPQGFGTFDDTLILSNHTARYLKAFLLPGVFFESPMVKWAEQAVGVRLWSEVMDDHAMGRLSKAERRVIALNQDHGVLAGVSIAFPETTSRTKGAIGLCARPGLSQKAVDALWRDRGREIWVLNSILHLKISTLPVPLTPQQLSKRQREVLEWVADGKTTADIALLMGLTAATVEKHLRLARLALQAETTAQAVLKATLRRQLFLPRPKDRASNMAKDSMEIHTRNNS